MDTMCNKYYAIAKSVHRNKYGGWGQTYIYIYELLGEEGNSLNCKFKTFGILDTSKVRIQSNYLASTTLFLLQTKLADKKTVN